MTTLRPAVLATRATFPDIAERLREHFDVDDNPADAVFSPAELARRLQRKQGVMSTGSERIDAALLDACPELRAVCNVGVGYNNVDVEACTARGVLVTNTPDVLTETTADFGFALMMATARRIAESERFLHRGEWTKTGIYDMFVGSDVHGATLGILGMGRIGQAIARRGALGFGMRVIYHNRSALVADVEAGCRATYVDKETLLRQADHLVLVLPYSPSSHHTIGQAELELMKPSATLTNIARGGIVDDGALALALRNGTIAAAGLDVFEGEPKVHPDLLPLPNVVLTPHIGSASVRTRRAMAALSVDNLIAALGFGPQAGRPPTPVNPRRASELASEHAGVKKLVVMGVAGCGKSTLAARLAQSLACPMFEGDDFHLAQSQDKMRDGIPLADADREPWLDRLGQLMAWRTGDVVLTCSALRRSYRERLRSRVPGLRFVFIDIDVAAAADRVGSRSGHLFPKSLVTSQFSALEPPLGEPGVVSVSAHTTLDQQTDAVLQWLAAAPEMNREENPA